MSTCGTNLPTATPPFNAAADVAATLVLQHLQSVCGIEIPRMDERLAADGPLCADQAEEYIQKLLAEREAAHRSDKRP